MKNISFFLSLFLMTNFVYSAGFERTIIRSSYTVNAFARNVVSTGTCYVDSLVVISSPSSLGATFTFFDTSTTVSGIIGSSSPVYNIDTPGIIYPVNKNFKYGIGYGKTGTGGIEIKYDFIGTIPKGKENQGY